MKRFLYVLVVCLLPIVGKANGDPVVEYCALTLSKAPIPRAIPEIQIEREDLLVELLAGCSRLKVEYTLHNKSDKQFENIHYGFPVDWEGEGAAHWVGDYYSESMYQKGWSEDYVKDFSFYINDKQVSASVSGDTLLRPVYTSGDWHREYGYPNWQAVLDSILLHNMDVPEWFDDILAEYEWEGEYTDTLVMREPLFRRWYYTCFSIRPRETVKLRVEYTIQHPHSIGLYAGAQNEFSIDFSLDEKQARTVTYNKFFYDYSPAAAWGNGTVQELNIDIYSPGKKVWSPEYSYKELPLYKGHYQKQYINFDYATAEPLRLEYVHTLPDSLDVIAIRNHRLPADKYKILSHNNDTTSYLSLKDLSPCTGAELIPTDSGNYVLEIMLDEPMHITGLVIMNGNCCDSLSWVSNGRMEKMQIMYLGSKSWSTDKILHIYNNGYFQDECFVDESERINNCKIDCPKDFTWEGLVSAAEKINVLPRHMLDYVDPSEKSEHIQHLRIIIPKQEQVPYLSELILLYDKR
jgi:hypothetical protein